MTPGPGDVFAAAVVGCLLGLIMGRIFQKQTQSFIDPYGPLPLPLNQFLSSDGVGGGNINFNADYSSEEEIAFIQPVSGEVARIHDVIFTIEDNGAISSGNYGAIVGGLSVGLECRVLTDVSTEVLSIGATVNATIKRNGDFLRYTPDVLNTVFSVGNQIIVAHLEFDLTPIRLIGNELDRLEVVLNDDLTGLISHCFYVRGYWEER